MPGDTHAVQVRPVAFRSPRDLPRIPSQFVTDRVFRLRRTDREHGGVDWRLEVEELSQPFNKIYDDGDPEDWLESYVDAGRPADFSYAVATRGDSALGMVTWKEIHWNRTLWLIDIRVEPTAQRRRTGTAMLDYLKTAAGKIKARGISLETQITNYPAICFYLNHGFAVVGFNDHLYTNHDLEEQDVALFLFWEARSSR